MPPAGAANPCTAPSPAFARHTPPHTLVTARSSRAGGVRRPARSRRRDRAGPAERRMPSRASASDSGFARMPTETARSPATGRRSRCWRSRRAAIRPAGRDRRRPRREQHRRAAQAGLPRQRAGTASTALRGDLGARCPRSSEWRQRAAAPSVQRAARRRLTFQEVERLAAAVRRQRRDGLARLSSALAAAVALITAPAAGVDRRPHARATPIARPVGSSATGKESRRDSPPAAQIRAANGAASRAGSRAGHQQDAPRDLPVAATARPPPDRARRGRTGSARGRELEPVHQPASVAGGATDSRTCAPLRVSAIRS